MNPLAIILITVNSIMLIALPRKWAVLPMIIGACYMTLDQKIDIGAASLTMLRILIIAGFIRVVIRNEKIANPGNMLDYTILAWSMWAMFSGFYHYDPLRELIFRIGIVGDACGIYFLVRILCGTLEDFVFWLKILSIALIPVALEMIYEQVTAHNLFSIFGGVPESPRVREGRLRAQGPFAHSILAGTVAAILLPLMFSLVKIKKELAYAGIVACSVMIITCSSSGPILTAAAGLSVLPLWYFKNDLKKLRYSAVIGYILLGFIMEDPPYYIMARIDITGGSTGWHRARLIRSSLEHLKEWWLWGTDYTRHWMPTGVSWSPDHTDITNQYIKMGVIGGLPLTIIYIISLWVAFKNIGKIMKHSPVTMLREIYPLWGAAAALFAITITGLSIAFFDQSVFFLYMILGVSASVCGSNVDMGRASIGELKRSGVQ
jgi:hypothetical protein